MKAGRGKEKGSSYERFISSVLDTWWEVEPKTFWRSVNSGGVWDAGDNTARKAGAEDFPFVTECKHYKDMDLLELLYARGQALFMRWWEQAYRAASKVKKVPILFFRLNYKSDFVVLPYVDQFKSLLEDNRKSCIIVHAPSSNAIVKEAAKRSSTSEIFPVDVIIFRLSSFLLWYPKEKILEVFKEDH